VLALEVPTAGSAVYQEIGSVDQEEDHPEHVEDVQGQEAVDRLGHFEVLVGITLLVLSGGSQGVVAQCLQNPEGQEEQSHNEHDEGDKNDVTVLGHENGRHFNYFRGQIDSALETAEENQDSCSKEETGDRDDGSGRFVLEESGRPDLSSHRLGPDIDAENDECSHADEDQDVDEAPSCATDDQHHQDGEHYRYGDGK
jgi:hypothetical protein